MTIREAESMATAEPAMVRKTTIGGTSDGDMALSIGLHGTHTGARERIGPIPVFRTPSLADIKPTETQQDCLRVVAALPIEKDFAGSGNSCDGITKLRGAFQAG
jgi:hypothetical protein